jgi:2-haloalkanoic acid dehalogenase type II
MPEFANNDRPTAVIFDIYDTLFANTLEAWQKVFREICAGQNLPVEPEKLRATWRNHELAFRRSRVNIEDPGRNPEFESYETAWTRCFGKAFAELNLQGDAASAAGMAVGSLARRRPFPETFDALEALSTRVRLGVFSNADDSFLLPLLARHELSFEAIASSESARVYKPDTAAFEHILDLMDLRPEQAWYVGDNPFDDVLGASRVGMKTIWVNRTNLPPCTPPADATIADLREIVGMLDGAS